MSERKNVYIIHFPVMWKAVDRSGVVVGRFVVGLVVESETHTQGSTTDGLPQAKK